MGLKVSHIYLFAAFALIVLADLGSSAEPVKFGEAGLQPVNISDPNVQANAKLSIQVLEKIRNHKDKLKLVEVIKAGKQVGVGTMYHLKLKVSNPKNETKFCKVKVLEQKSIADQPRVIFAGCRKTPPAGKQ